MDVIQIEIVGTTTVPKSCALQVVASVKGNTVADGVEHSHSIGVYMRNMQSCGCSHHCTPLQQIEQNYRLKGDFSKDL